MGRASVRHALVGRRVVNQASKSFVPLVVSCDAHSLPAVAYRNAQGTVCSYDSQVASHVSGRYALCDTALINSYESSTDAVDLTYVSILPSDRVSVASKKNQLPSADFAVFCSRATPKNIFFIKNDDGTVPHPHRIYGMDDADDVELIMALSQLRRRQQTPSVLDAQRELQIALHARDARS